MNIRTIVLLVLLVSPSAAAAQDLTFRVVDPRGGAVSGAALEIRSFNSSPRVFSGVTDAQGMLTLKANSPLGNPGYGPGF